MTGLSATRDAEGRARFMPPDRGGPRRVDWEKVVRDLAPIRCDTEPASVRRKSRDFYWYSPILEPELADKVADLVAVPADIDELKRLVRYCVAHNIPVTPRGGGSGNYGQCMPLHGGVVVDTTALTGIVSLEDGLLRVRAGTRMKSLAQEIDAQGWELRIFPSTIGLSTIGGFIAGGSAGVGAITWGTTLEWGNVSAVQILTIEDEPRLVELRGADLRKAVHAYGTTGIITEIEMPLAPKTRWREVILSCGTMGEALRLADRLARADGLLKRQVSVLAADCAALVGPLRSILRPDEAIVLLVVAERSWPACAAVLAGHGARPIYERGADETHGRLAPIYEFAWNHTTLHALKAEPAITYLQTLFPAPDAIGRIERMIAEFGDELPMHVEFVRMEGAVQVFGIQLLRYTSEARLREICARHEAAGCPIYDAHTYLLENGAKDTADPVQFAFKQEVDPYGLANPGKMPGFLTPERGFVLPRAT